MRLSALFHPYLLLLFILAGSLSANGQTVTTGKSFVNITRPNGGTFLPGDIIEVRATIAVTGGNSTNRVNSIRYNDTINLAKLIYIPGSLEMISNEGRRQYGYTDAADPDSANIDIASGRLRFNIGNNAGACNVNTQGNSTINSGRLWGSLRPTFYGGTCIRVYSYRVQIRNTPSIVDIDTTVILSAGNFRYTIGLNNFASNFPPYQIKIAPDLGLCSNAFGTNAILGESGGTFGSGVAQNRAGGTTFVPAPYSFKTFSTNTPNDNFYGLANRTSADGTTNGNVPYSTGVGSASRVFSVWDIIGDHTGAANPLLGNPPTNTGYAVIINASYETNRAFTQNITNVCEETYYEFSAWFRNICRRCACDSTGKGASQSGYTPAPGNDSSGVRPNLNFQIDGQDIYTSGNIAYTGEWVKKGFVFKTRAGQTSFTLTIRNNAPGGGGNDWAIDDIQLATCLPNMKYSPSITPTVCVGNALKLQDTVRSYFNNYVYYKWQRSTDGGANWSDITGPVGPVGTTWNGTAYEYVSTYNVPPANTTLANAGDKYRLIVATSTNNISNLSCQYTDNANPITLNILDCQHPLATKVVNFTGSLRADNKAQLKWTVTKNEDALYYEVERSLNGRDFTVIGTVSTPTSISGENSLFNFTDPASLNGQAWYRINIRGRDNSSGYSRTLLLSPANKGNFDFVTVVNPFNSHLLFDISSTRSGMARATLVDQLGHVVKQKVFDIVEGVNTMTWDNTHQLQTGVYILRLEMDGLSIYKRVLKR